MMLLAALLLVAPPVPSVAPVQLVEPEQAAKRRRGPVRAKKAVASVASEANRKAVMRYAPYGRDCPERANPQSSNDWEQPLQFTLVPSGKGKALLIGGKFTAGDSDRLRTFLSTAGPITEVQFDSGGGNAAEGPKLGRVIRAAGLSTHVVSQYACISSCSMAFLGGVLRTIDDDSIYGLHTFFSSGFYNSLEGADGAERRKNLLHSSEQSNAILAGEIQQYGQQMGISRRFFTDVMFAQRSEVFISDAQIGQLRRDLQAAYSPEGAKAQVLKMASYGLFFLSTDQGLEDANDFIGWLGTLHDQTEVDQRLALLLSNDFRCISASELRRYNITNVVRR